MEINGAAKSWCYSWLSVSFHVSRVTRKWSLHLSPQGKWGQIVVQVFYSAGCQLPLWGSGERMYVPSSYRNGKAAAPVEVSSWGGSVLRSGHLSPSLHQSGLNFWAGAQENAVCASPWVPHSSDSHFVLNPACISSWETRSVRTPRHPWGHLLPHVLLLFSSNMCSTFILAVCRTRNLFSWVAHLWQWPTASAYRLLKAN